MEPKLLSGQDYPNPYREFVKMFPDNTACATFIKSLRWPKGFICLITEKDVTHGYDWS